MYENIKLETKICNNISSKFIENIISELHNDTVKINNFDKSGDIYAELNNMGYNLNKRYIPNNTYNTSFALKAILKEIINDYNKKQEIYINNYINEQIETLKLTSTSNPDIMINSKNEYYCLDKNYKFVLAKNIINVFEDGTYDKKEYIFGPHNDYIIAKYNKENKQINIKLVNKRNIPYNNQKYVANKLKFKQELVNKFKLRGYSGCKNNFILSLINKFFKPLPSGYYIDEKLCIYKWNTRNSEFKIEYRNGLMPGAPEISDYDIRDKCVIRTDYDGKI